MGWVVKRHASAEFATAQKPGTNCTVGFGGPRGDLDGCGKESLLSPQEFESQTVLPVASLQFPPSQSRLHPFLNTSRFSVVTASNDVQSYGNKTGSVHSWVQKFPA